MLRLDCAGAPRTAHANACWAGFAQGGSADGMVEALRRLGYRVEIVSPFAPFR